MGKESDGKVPGDPYGDLLAVFQNLWARETDLLHDMGHSEAFLIDGESLVMEALYDPRSSPATPLSCIYPVERLLASLPGGSNRADFTIVFFSAAYRAAWEAWHPGAWPLRCLMQSHLTAIGLPVVDFAPLPGQQQQQEGFTHPAGDDSSSPSWEAHFAAYLQRTLPAFVLVSDVFARAQEDDMAKPSLPGVPPGLAALTMALTLRCLAQRVNVAYLSSLRCDTITAYAFLASAEKNGQTAAPESTRHLITAALAAALPPPMKPRTPVLSQAALMALHQQLGSARLAAGVYACTTALRQPAPTPPLQSSTPAGAEVQSWLADCWLLHLCLLAVMPLSSRALRQLPGLDPFILEDSSAATPLPHLSSTVHDFLGSVLSAGAQAFQALSRVSCTEQLLQEQSDAYDCRLFMLLVGYSLAHMESATCASGQPNRSPNTSSIAGYSASAQGPLLGLPQPIQVAWQQAMQALHGSAMVPPSDRLPLPPASALRLLQRQGSGSSSGLHHLVTSICKHALCSQTASDRTFGLPPAQHMFPSHATPSACLNGNSSVIAAQVSGGDTLLAGVLQQCGLEAPANAHQHSIKALGSSSSSPTLLSPAAAAPLMMPSLPYEEQYHWHIRKELEPAYLSEAVDEEQRLREHMRAVDSLKDTDLLNLESHLDIRLRKRDINQVAQKMAMAERQEDGTMRASLKREARKMVKEAIEQKLNRQKQMDSRALNKMVSSLQGTATFISTAKSQAGTSGQGGGGSKKAARIIEENKAKKAEKVEGEGMDAWATVDAKIMDWLRKADWSDLIQGPLEWLDQYASKHQTPELLQVALGTRAMVLHLAIKECMKQQAAGAGSKRAATGSSASLTPLVTELLLTVQKLYVLDAEALMQPILHQVAADSSSDSKKSKSNKSASSQSEAAPSSSAGTSKQAKGSSKSNGQSQGHSGVAVRVMSSKSGRTTCAVAAVLAALHSIGFSSVADRLAQELSLSYATAQATQGSDSGASKSKATGKGSSNKGDKVTGPAPGTAAGSHNSHEVQEQILSALAAATAAVKLSSVQLPAGMCPVRFQLREMGHLLVRPPSGLPKDGRVGGFDPDDWQRKVLDIVDAGSSAVISAPTSSGKTFISSYVIGKVLKETPDGRVVIVLPTKALVNQLTAQVHKDFANSFPDDRLIGVFTRDFRKDVHTARVLITVPQCMEILMLTPTHRAWLGTFKYAILDEVHCMNERGQGDVWERLMLSLRCPVLALSATIGNPQPFTSWLQRVKALQRQQDEAAQRAPRSPKEYEVHLVVHTERYNDILLHAYCPAIGQPEEGDDAPDSSLVEGGGAMFPKPPLAPAPVWTTTGVKGGRTAQAAATPSAPGDSEGARLQPLHAIAGLDLSAGTEDSPKSPLISAADTPAQNGSAGTMMQAALGQPAAATSVALAPPEALQLYDALLGAASQIVQQRSGSDSVQSSMAAAQAPGGLSSPRDQLTQLQSALDSSTEDTYMPAERDYLQRLLQLEPASTLGPSTATTSSTPDDGCNIRPACRQAGPTSLVTRPAAKAWAAAVVSLFLSWRDAGGEWAEAAARVQAQLCGQLEKSLSEYEAAWSQQASPGVSCHGKQAQVAHLMPLLRSLHARGMLPAIIFNFDRSACELYAKVLLTELEASEKHFREKYRIQLEEQLRLRRQAAAGAAAAAVEAASGGRVGEAEGAEAVPAVSRAPIVIDGIVFNADIADEDKVLPDPSFTFMTHDKANNSLLEEALEGLEETEGIDETLIAALRRGIGVHHSGLHKRYRQAVEMLFRNKTLQVVIATGTLAYGIHMPCKAVVMAGDSIFLDSLNFRQMSGRAGRRGLDTLGHCVFYCVPIHKVKRLLGAPLPRLRGQYLMSPTLALRAALLSHQLRKQSNGIGKAAAGAGKRGGATSSGNMQDPHVAVDLVGSIIAESFLRPTLEATSSSSSNSIGNSSSDPIQQQLLHSFCTSLRLLMDLHLLNAEGQPVGLAGLATHLFWAEPANLVLVRLLTSGALMDVISGGDTSTGYGGSGALSASKLEALATVVAHLFVREPLQPARAAVMRRAASGTSPSVVVLPPMPPRCAEVVKQYNAQVLATVTQCVVAFAAALEAEGHAKQDVQLRLPLSGLLHRPQPSITASQAAGAVEAALQHQHSQQPQSQLPSLGSLLLGSKQPLAVPSVAASPFAALTGRGDTYASVQELVYSCKPHIHLDSASIPVLELRDRLGRTLPLNAYFLDYYKHGQSKAIIRDNRIPDGEAWESLRAMQGILAAITTSLELLEEENGTLAAASPALKGRGTVAGQSAGSQLARAFQELSTTFSAKFRQYSTMRQAI